MRCLAAMGALLLMVACSGRPGPEDPLLSDSEFELQVFFDAWLTVTEWFQDIFGPVGRRFEGWLRQVAEDKVVNKAYMQRFGVCIGEVVILFELR